MADSSESGGRKTLLLRKRASPEEIRRLSDVELARLLEEIEAREVQLEAEKEYLVEMQIAVEESRSKYFSLFEHSPCPCLLLDQSGRVLEMNLAAGRLLGIGRSNMSLAPFSLLVLPEHRDQFHHHRRMVLQGGSPRSCQIRLGRKGRTPFEALVTTVLVSSGGEDSHQMLSTVSDVTGQQSAKEILERTRQYSQDLASQLFKVLEHERMRVAHEIHDNLGGYFSAIKYRIEHALDAMKAAPAEAEKTLHTLVAYVQEAIVQCRMLQLSVRPSLLDDVGLVPALSWFSREFQTSYPNIRLETRIELQDEDISPEHRILVYRILQEAMNNVAKHSRAGRAEMLVTRNGDRLEVVVRDDGRGFDLEEAFRRKSGMGLVSMRERATLMGGTLHIDSAAEKGTVVRLTCPLRSPPE
ncbi:MAG: ATP-binding protein [bacterium]